MISFPKIDPVALQIGDYFAIRWYSLAYIVSIIIAFYLVRVMVSKKDNPLYPIHTKIWDFLPYTVFGIIIGGRLGHVIFYDPIYYMNNPLKIFAIWQGGMSFHGGFIGMIAATYLFVRNKKISFLAFSDIILVVAPIGLFFGRIANFINDELYGIATNMPWGVNFPNGGGISRHPVQIYEAIFEGLVAFVILYFFYKKYYNYKGRTTAMFLILYSIFRFFAEYFKEEETPLPQFLSFITMGQLLSIPMFIAAIVILVYFKDNNGIKLKGNKGIVKKK